MKCCKPHSKKKSKCKSSFRSLTEAMIKKLVALGCKKKLSVKMVICDSCRLYKNYTPKKKKNASEPSSSTESVVNRIVYNQDDPQPSTSGQQSKLFIADILNSSSQETLHPSVTSLASSTSIKSTVERMDRSKNIFTFNHGIDGIKVTPIKAKETNRSASYRQKKLEQITSGVKRHLFDMSEDIEQEDMYSKAMYFDEMISQLKDKFLDDECTKDERMIILSILPQSWTVNQIVKEFNASRYLAEQVRSLIAEKGILRTGEPALGHGLSTDLKQQVLTFYDNDDVSRVMPGQRDYVTEGTGSIRQTVQKRLLMMSLKECYVHFKEAYKTPKISFSSFAALRPKHCKLLSVKGTHNVCVCVIHENVNLIWNSLKKLHIEGDVSQYTEKLLCDAENRTDDCYLRVCPRCIDLSLLETDFTDQLEAKEISEIFFEQWKSTDRCNIEPKRLPSADFVPFLADKLSKLIKHNFIKDKQSQFLKNSKKNLKAGEAIVICDFSENYSFVLQDEVQSYHWNNAQCTIHPFVVYFNDNGTQNHLSFVVISEVIKHDTIAVQLFIDKLVVFLKTKITVQKMIFISDGAASQYKNRKNFASLCGFKNRHNIDIEWHFFATSHGKGPCDAIGGTLKRMATRASLAKEHEHPITNPKQLYDWASHRRENLDTKISFCFVTSEEYEKAENELSVIFDQTKSIPGTQKYHSFIPIGLDKVAVKIYSSSYDEPKIFDIFE